MERRDAAALDRHITGNYGEDQMKGVSVLESHKVNNLAELLLVLKRMSLNPLHQICDTDVCINDSPATVTLECQTLTDGSEVYNIAIESVR